MDPRIEIIAARLACGEPLTRICQDPQLPSMVEFYAIVRRDETAAALIQQAREDAAHTLAAQMLEIVDEPMPGEKSTITTGENPGEKVEQFDNVARSALRLKARQWLAERLLPKAYGQRVQQTIDAPGGLTIITGVPQPEPDADPASQ